MLGGLLFGIATFRAGILPRWAAGLLAIAAALTPAAALLPHQIQRLAAIPVALALACLGYAPGPNGASKFRSRCLSGPFPSSAKLEPTRVAGD